MGCGWLGLPLAKALLKKGHTIRGTTTSSSKIKELQASGIDAFTISLGEREAEGPLTAFLEGLDILIINIPPKLRSSDAQNYVEKMKLLKDSLLESPQTKVLFVSSTSVYGDIEGEVTETTTPVPTTESGKQLLESEQLFYDEPRLSTTVVRFGGLIGPGRHPVTHLSGRTGLKNGTAPVNLIHLEDCLRILMAIIEHNWWGLHFNAVYPEHPTRAAYYAAESEKKGLPVPEFLPEKEGEKGKRVSSSLLLQKGFEFAAGIRS